jgi:hypothetical protein
MYFKLEEPNDKFYEIKIVHVIFIVMKLTGKQFSRSNWKIPLNKRIFSKRKI